MHKVISLLEENIKSITVSAKNKRIEETWGDFFIDMNFNDIRFEKKENEKGYYFYNIHNKFTLLKNQEIAYKFIDSFYQKIILNNDEAIFVVLPNNFPEWILTNLFNRYYEDKINKAKYKKNKTIFIREYLFSLMMDKYEKYDFKNIEYSKKRYKIKQIINSNLNLNDYLNLINKHLDNEEELKYEFYSSMGVFIQGEWKTLLHENTEIPFSSYLSFSVPVNHSEFIFKIYSKSYNSLLVELANFNIKANNSTKEEQYYLKYDFSFNYSGVCYLFNDKQEIVKKESISLPNLIYMV